MLQNKNKKAVVYLLLGLIVVSSLCADEISRDVSQEIVEQENVAMHDVSSIVDEEEAIMDDEELSSFTQEESPEVASEDDLEEQSLEDQEQKTPVAVPRRIGDIIIVGNEHTPSQAMLNYIPYKVGEIFSPQKSGTLIRNLYKGLKRFRNITLKGVAVGEDMVDLYVIVEEKKPLKDIIFKGNDSIQEKEFFKKIDMDVPALDEEELKVFSEQIKKLYYDKGFQRISNHD